MKSFTTILVLILALASFAVAADKPVGCLRVLHRLGGR